MGLLILICSKATRRKENVKFLWGLEVNTDLNIFVYLMVGYRRGLGWTPVDRAVDTALEAKGV